MELCLLDILKPFGFRPTDRTRLVRHMDPKRFDIQDIIRSGHLELYQSYQSRPIFKDVDQFVAFYGQQGTRGAFYGVYRVLAQKPAREGRVDPDCPWSSEWRDGPGYFYDLERLTRFDTLRHRVIIQWGAATRSWVQRKMNKEVLAIREPGRFLLPFNDYLEVNLSYDQIQDLFKHQEAHPDWRAQLSAVSGVYLILAEESGNLYVGSAYGEGGIWGRWAQYARSGHGGNVLLRKLIARAPKTYPRRFRFSILQILPKTMATKQVVLREAEFKVKLGTRATGLNS
jgi:hypothetical protein